MNDDELKKIKPPQPPVPSSIYGSEEDTEAYERAIEKIMRQKKVDYDTAVQIYHTQ